MRLFSLVSLCCALFAAASMRAHSAPGSSVILDFRADHLDAEVRLPVSELQYAFRPAFGVDPADLLARFRGELTSYLCRHLVVRSPDLRPWTVEVELSHVTLDEQPVDLVAHARLRPPPGAPLRRFDLHYDAISHEVMNHIVMVTVRSDWNLGKLGSEPELIGTLRAFATGLQIDRDAGSAWRGFGELIRTGARHIAEGTDHLLFLFTLLLPAPLLAARGRWDSFGGWRHAFSMLGRIVTAFTLGHSVTLALAAVGWVRLPERPVEVLIAVSIFVSALHAWRPLLHGREVLIAAGFGLIHGLAFAATLSELHLTGAHLVGGLFAFNLGIETAQLALVLALVPWLVLLSRTAVYRYLRHTGAAFAALAAVGWGAERALGWSTPVPHLVTKFAASAAWGVALLAGAALVLTWAAARSCCKPRVSSKGSWRDI